jgi:glycosyltransferase involved in cell wall biosynthesis
MRLLRLIRSVNPAGGGPVEGLKQASAVLVAQGHRVEVASLDSQDEPGVAGFPLPLQALGHRHGGYGYAPGFAPWLRSHASDFDAVIVDGVWQYHSFGAWRALRGTRTPYFVYPHGMLDPWFKRTYPLKHLKKWLYWPWAEYRVLRDARAALFTCDRERELARESFWLYRCHERVVSFGTAEPGGHAEHEREEFLAAHPQLRGRRFLVFLGRVHEKKGVDLLLRAFAHARAGQAKDLHLVIAGPGTPELFAQLKSLSGELGVTERVHWTGLLQGALKWGALRAAEAFVLASHQENFGLAVVEALACGVPVLISDQVNICREIERDGGGFVARDTLPETTAMLDRWATLPETGRSLMRRQARACFEQRYEIQRVTQRLVDTLRESGVAG